MTDEKKIPELKEFVIENWSVYHLEAEKISIPILIGEVNGKEIKTDTLFWLDTENKIAMTKKDIYRLGRPHEGWYSNLVALGYKLKDADIKGTNH